MFIDNKILFNFFKLNEMRLTIKPFIHLARASAVGYFPQTTKLCYVQRLRFDCFSCDENFLFLFMLSIG